ncbi:MAG: VanZ family protein [Candidatus Neomarinimicrobiota bacterium]
MAEPDRFGNRYRLILIIYLALIILGSSIPGRSFPQSKIFSYDKLLHLMEYAVAGLFASRCLIKINLKSVLLLLIGGLAFAAFDEFWQSFIPGRNPDILDLIADNFGIWIGLGIGIPLRRIQGND